MSYLQWPTHDPGDVKDYTIDWSQWLTPGDTISASTWILPSGLTQQTALHTDTISTIWISGIGSGPLMGIQNTITTAQGRKAVRTVILPVGAN